MTPWLLLALMAIAPIPLGSTPPLAWTIWGVLVGLMAIGFALTRLASSNGLGQLNPAFVIGQVGFAVLCLYLVVQVLPLDAVGGVIPLPIANGTVLETTSISIAPGDTILMLVRMLTFGLLFYLTAQVAQRQSVRRLLMNGVVIVVTLHALQGLLALFQFGDTLLVMPKDRYLGDATGTFLNRNTFATYLAMGTALALTCAMRSMVRTSKDKVRLTYSSSTVLYLVAAGIMITTVLTTHSRAGFAVTVVGIVTVLICTLAGNIRALKPVLFAAPVLLVVFAGTFLRLGEDIWLRYEDVGDSFEFRFELYRQAMELIALRPWTGFGGGTFEMAFPAVHSATLPNQLTWNEAHNTYLELWSDLGLVFGSIPILLAAGLFVLLAFRMARGKGSWAGQTAALATLAIAAIHSLFDFSLEIEAVAFLFVVICAIGLAATSAQRVEE